MEKGYDFNFVEVILPVIVPKVPYPSKTPIINGMLEIIVGEY